VFLRCVCEKIERRVIKFHNNSNKFRICWWNDIFSSVILMLFRFWTQTQIFTHITQVIHLLNRRLRNHRKFPCKSQILDKFTPEKLLIFINSILTHITTQFYSRKLSQFLSNATETMTNKNILVIAAAENLSTMPFTSRKTTEMGMSWKCEWGKYRRKKINVLNKSEPPTARRHVVTSQSRV
jgi:hypothetical protein